MKPTHRIKNIHRSERFPGKIYAELHNLSEPEGDQLEISATLEYILNAIKNRGYIVEEVGNI